MAESTGTAAAAVAETASERSRADAAETLAEEAAAAAVTEAVRNDRSEARPAVQATEAHLLTAAAAAAVVDIGTEAPVEVAAVA